MQQVRFEFMFPFGLSAEDLNCLLGATEFFDDVNLVRTSFNTLENTGRDVLQFNGQICQSFKGAGLSSDREVPLSRTDAGGFEAALGTSECAEPLSKIIRPDEATVVGSGLGKEEKAHVICCAGKDLLVAKV